MNKGYWIKDSNGSVLWRRRLKEAKSVCLKMAGNADWAEVADHTGTVVYDDEGFRGI